MMRTTLCIAALFLAPLSCSYAQEGEQTAISVETVVSLYQQGRFDEAIPVAEALLEQDERSLGPEHPDTLQSVNNLAALYQATGRYEAAEPLFRRALEAQERVLGSDHLEALASLNNLAALYQATGRYEAAEPLYRRALEARERALGPEHPRTLLSVNNLAALYYATGRYEAAVPLNRRALEVQERVLGPEHPRTLVSVNNLALIYRTTGRYEAAEPLYRRALEAQERVLGPEHLETLESLSNLAGLYQATGRYEAAEPLYRRALEAKERALGPEHPSTLISVNILARFRATSSARSSAPPDLLLELVSNGLAGSASRWSEDAIDPLTLSNPVSAASRSADMVRAYHDLLLAGDIAPQEATYLGSGFRLAQAFVFSSAADALRASTAALTVDDPELRARVDDANEASAALEAAEAALAILLSQPVSDQNPAAIEYAQGRVDEAFAALQAANDALIAADLDLADLAVARTSGLEAVQAVLARDEALIFYSQAAADDPLTVFVVTPASAAALPLDVAPEQLEAAVAGVRSGLELDPGEDYRLNTADLRAQAFDMEMAKALHDAIFEPLREHLGRARRLLVVADGPLQTLPLHVLVSELPDPEVDGFARYRAADWLSEEFAFARLPAVSSLVALRREATPPPSGERQLIGFGDPVLAGYDDAPAQSSPGGEVFFQFANASGATQIDDLPALRQTGVLLREVQTTLDLPDEDVYLGPQAVEAALERLNTGGRLQDYRSLAFATHALINDEIEGLDEPAIVLTPTDDSDGLLRASEVVQLDLDAGLVILAACNTAAADGSPGAEALSGLAKAFYYAGARALLVSNWPAEAGATAELVPDLVQGIEDEGLPRSVALQRAMNTLRDDHDFDFYAHPALWAPFMVAADG